ncbi:hypothetical protein [Flavobacterium sp.]
MENQEEGLTDADIHFATTVMMESKGAGKLVETKTGKIGRTYNHEGLVNGKYQVYCTDGSKLLCSPENLTLKGFID